MRTVDVDLFGHLFEEWIGEVVSSGEPVLIVRDGKPIARVEPINRKHAPKSFWGAHKGHRTDRDRVGSRPLIRSSLFFCMR